MVRDVVVWGCFGIVAGIGAVLRFVVDGSVTRGRIGTLPLGGVPVGTLVVNLSGALVLGVLDGAGLSKDVTLVLGTGLIGAYTTFSTWVFETQRLTEERQTLAATLNIGVSLAVGIAAAALGLWIGGRL